MSLRRENFELWLLLDKACSKHGVGTAGIINPPTGNTECVDYLVELLKQYTGPDDNDSRAAWLDEQIPIVFPAFGERPRWIQSPEWPFAGGEPMRFVGQHDIMVWDKEPAPRWFHDDTSFYIFVSKHAPPEVIMHQY